MTESEVGRAINDLEGVEPFDETYSRGPFSVFKIEWTPGRESSPELPHVSANTLSEQGKSWIDDRSGDHSTTTSDTDHRSNEPLPYQSHPVVEEASPISDLPPPHHVSRVSPTIIESCDVDQTCSTPSGLALAFVEPARSFTRDDSNEEYLGSPLDALFLRPTFITSQVKYLLDHYRSYVMCIYSMLENKKTPWHLFHIPRAFQCCTELEVVGHSSPARGALLHAILSVSAYNLRNRHLGQKRSDSANQWSEIASNHRARALNYLRTSVSDPRAASTNMEYKELLAAMLSMITVDVVSGDTETCKIHLDGCESLIRARKRAGAKLSSKTRALHRIFFYLRVMQEAMPTAGHEPFTDTVGHPLANASDDVYPINSDELESWLDPQSFNGEGYDTSSWELIYGIPQGLIILVRKAARLLRCMRQRRESTSLELHLDISCDDLEDEILNFPVEEAVQSLETANIDQTNREILQHHIRAFHQSVVIYFSANIRQMHTRHLQQYVQTTIHHLEIIEDIKGRTGIIAQPILWPVFVAASQALDGGVRSRFLQFFKDIEIHGCGISTRAREILEDTWSNEGSRGWSQARGLLFQRYLMLT